MFQAIVDAWSGQALSFVSAPLVLLGGNINIFSVVAGLALLALLVGVVLLLIKPDRRARGLILPALLALIAPAALVVAALAMGVFGILFGWIFGIIALLIWVGLIARDADNRLGVLLLGLAFTGFAFYAGLVQVIPIWFGV